VNLAQRRFADREQKTAALFQRDVGRSMHEAVAVPVRDRAERLDAAGSDDHSLCLERPARDGGPHIGRRIYLGCQRLDLFA
jgi:hypothetical protein